MKKKGKVKISRNFYKIGLLILGILVAIPIVYLLFFDRRVEDGERRLVWRMPFTPKNLPDEKLPEAVSRFPETIRSLRSARDGIKKEGYELADPVSESTIVRNICSSIPKEKSEGTSEKLNGDCLDFTLISRSLENSESLSRKTRQTWANNLYRLEYERGQMDFSPDGVLDKKEAIVLRDKALVTLDQDFLTKTQPALVSLVRDIQNQDTLLQEDLIYNALENIVNASGAREGVITGEPPRGKTIKTRRKTLAAWIEGIYRLQVQNKLFFPRVDYGVIRDDKDPTYEKLKEAVLDALQVPRPVLLPARNQFSTTEQGTARIIRSIYNNLVNNPALEKSLENRYIGIIKERTSGTGKLHFQLEEDIKNKLSQVLQVRDYSLSYDFEPTIYESTTTKQDKWIAAIYRYQKYALGLKNPTGILSGNDQTSQHIIKEITQQFKDELQYY
ncbi:hypothetical protein [Pannus brasiliensis]